MTIDVNILIGRVSERDKWLFFGEGNKYSEFDGNFKEPFIKFPSKTRYPQLWKGLGIFKSTTEARKNGWDKDIPKGFSKHIIGKLRNRVTIYKKVTK